MLKTLIGRRVVTYDGHIGVVIKHFKPTGRDMTVHIKQDDGRIWYCPENNIVDGVRIDIWTHLMRGCIINYVH